MLINAHDLTSTLNNAQMDNLQIDWSQEFLADAKLMQDPELKSKYQAELPMLLPYVLVWNTML